MLTELEWSAVVLSLHVSSLAVVLCFPVALGLTFTLVRGPSYLRVLLNTISHLPLILPPVVTGYLLLIIFGANSVIGHWLADTFDIQFVFSLSGAVLATMVMTLPFQVRLLHAGFENVPREMLETAAILGASPVDRFCTITLPRLIPSCLAALTAAFAASLGQFGAVITFAANIPGQTQTIPLAIFSALQNPDGEAMAARLALLSVIIAICGLIISDRLLKKQDKL